MAQKINQHEKFMLAAIRLSQVKMQSGAGGPFGAVIVKNGKIIAKGWNQVTSKNDPTCHAEIDAIRKAAKKLKNFNLSGCILYSSCQPCPMCLASSYWARLDKIYYGCTASDAAAIDFDDSYISTQLTLPTDQQDLPQEQILRNKAWQVFELWRGKGDRLKY